MALRRLGEISSPQPSQTPYVPLASRCRDFSTSRSICERRSAVTAATSCSADLAANSASSGVRTLSDKTVGSAFTKASSSSRFFNRSARYELLRVLTAVGMLHQKPFSGSFEVLGLLNGRLNLPPSPLSLPNHPTYPMV